jgi:uncharacterized protein YjbI with pentapeptide repeats
MMLSGCGQMGLPAAFALEHADRARFVVDGKIGKQLAKLHIRKLTLHGAPPPWIGELRELRTLQCVPGAKLPDSLFTLPKLRNLHVDRSKLASLDRLGKLRSLEFVTMTNTPLGDDEAAVDALVATLKGARRTGFGIDVKRTPAPAPKDKAKLVKALRDGTLDDGADLRGCDLSGERFEDLLITYDLRGAKLANTTWVRCDFEPAATLSGADLSGATFYDCYLCSRYDGIGLLHKVNATGARWIGCGGDLQLDGATLPGARMLDMDPDFRLFMAKAKAQGLELHASFCSEREHQFDVKGTDLRGAHVSFDVDADRRAELKKKKTARLAWKQDHLKGAKTDKTTQVVYATLDATGKAPATRPAEATVDPKGKAAPILGTIAASNASLWLVIFDAEAAGAWRGSVDDDDEQDDFQRALRGKDGPIKAGDAQGVKIEIGDRGWSDVYRIDRGALLLDASTSIDDKRESARQLALRVAQWPATKPKEVGTVRCPSGVLALLLPYRDGKFTPKQLAKARGGKVVADPDEDRLLVPMPDGPGVYRVAQYPFRPEPGKGEYEDDVGSYGFAIAITYAGR